MRLGRRRETDFSDADQWAVRERELREKEVTTDAWLSWAQLGTAILAVVAVVFAGWAAWTAAKSAEVAKEGVRRTADESRLQTAMEAIGADLPAQRVAGFTLLTRHATQRVESANESEVTESERRDALRLYRGTVDILANYLAHPTPSSSSETATADALPVERGIGDPHLPRDFHYAAGRLRELLAHKDDFLRLRGSRDEPLPAIDLASVTLYGVHWRSIDFSGLVSRYFPGADLRRAKLTDSNWKAPKESPPTALTGAYLQCAELQRSNLEGANLQGAHLESVHLEDANLEGANLEGAHLQGAHLEGANVKGAIFKDAKIENGALDNAKHRKDALDADQQALPNDETRSDLEC